MSNTKTVCFIAPNTICNFCPDLCDIVGGRQKQQVTIGSHLNNSGFDVHFIVDNYGQPSLLRKSDIKLWKCDVSNGNRSRLSRSYEIFNSIRKISPDVIYVRGRPHLSIIGWFISNVLGCQYVHHISSNMYTDPNQMEYLNTFVRLGFLQSIRNSEVTIAQNNQQKANLESIDIDCVKIPNAHEVTSKDSIIPHEEREYFLWVGRIDSTNKKPLRFLHIAENCSGEFFKIIGRKTSEEKYYEKVRQKASELENVEFVGFVEPNQIDQYYSKAKALVNTSVSEGFPSTFLESWAFATPVLSMEYDLDGLLSSETGGILCEDLTSIIQKRTDPSTIKRLGFKGRDNLKNNYSVDSVMKRFQNVVFNN